MTDLRLDPDVSREDVYNWFKSERTAHAGTKKRLEELEEANQKLRELYYVERRDLAQFREYADTYYPDLWDCFESSRARKGEAMG